VTPAWIASIVLLLLGIAGTVMPALPGPTLVFAGIVVGAWADGFARIGPGLLVLCGVLMVLTFVADWGAALLGAKRAGASKLALAGAALGTLAGILSGLVGLLFMPLIGAAIGQYLEERHAGRAATVGVATWLGLLVGAAAKVALVLTMLGVFAAALLLG
jgi:uncharacterized protein